MPAPNVRCGLLTPPATGAIAVVRVAGVGAWERVRRHVRGRRRPLPEATDPGCIHLGVFHADGDALDDVIVACACGADGEQIVDVSCHGGLRIVERIVSALAREGAKWISGDPASALERSWVDCVRDAAYARLTATTTRRGALFLLRQAALLPVYLAALVREAETGDVAAAREELRRLVARSRGAWFFYRPAEVAFVGPPNSGKSSLANRLAGAEGVIVTDRAGTTRDWVVLRSAIDGVPVNLIDTAGVRPTVDTLEQAAIQAGRRRAGTADVLVLVLDGAVVLNREGWSHWADAKRGAAIVALNKADLERAVMPEGMTGFGGAALVRVSARTGRGVAELRAAILGALLSAELTEDADVAAVFDPAWWARLAEVASVPRITGPELARRIQAVFVAP